MLRKPFPIALILVALVMAGCIKREGPKKISLEKKKPLQQRQAGTILNT